MADITEFETEQLERANASGRTPIVFVHGLWLLPSSWDPWRPVFEDAGFTVSVANLKFGFVPVSAHRHGHDHRRDLLAWLDYYSREKVLLRFTRPPS